MFFASTEYKLSQTSDFQAAAARTAEPVCNFFELEQHFVALVVPQGMITAACHLQEGGLAQSLKLIQIVISCT